MYSNSYIFRFAIIMVVLVAAVLALASQLLKPYQERNVRIEKMQEILRSANVDADATTSEALYKTFIVEELVLNRQGEVTSRFTNEAFEKGATRAFDLNLKVEYKKLDDLNSGKSAEEPQLPLFVCEKEGQRYYIVPLLGKGLWGPIWGNLAFKADMNTIYGTTFGHAKETPGLGAEIASKALFQDQFIGKKIFDQNGQFVSITVVKGGVANASMEPDYGVDAISGGTITSNGVTEMLKTCLTNYEPFFKKNS